MVLLDHKDLKANKVYKDHKDQLVLEDQMVKKVNKVLEVHVV